MIFLVFFRASQGKHATLAGSRSSVFFPWERSAIVREAPHLTLALTLTLTIASHRHHNARQQEAQGQVNPPLHLFPSFLLFFFFFSSNARSDEADSPPSRHLSPFQRVLNDDQDPRLQPHHSYSSFYAYSHSHSPSPIPLNRTLPSASPDKTPHRALPSRNYPSANSRSLSIASLLNSEAPAPPSPEPEYHILPPIKNKAFSASPDPDGENSDDMTRLKNASRKGDEAPRHRLPSNISPVSSSSHSVGTSAEPRSHGSITPNAREQAIRDRIKARKAVVRKEDVAAKPSLPLTNKPRMASPELIVRETDKVVEVATHVAADRNATTTTTTTTKERPSYDNDSDESDLFVRSPGNSVSSKCDTPMKSVTPERERIPKASTEAASETAPVVVATGPTQPAETAKKPEAPAKSEGGTNQTIPSKKPQENDDPTRAQARATAGDDSSDDDVPLRVRRLGSTKSGGSTRNTTTSPTENGSVRATPSNSFWGRKNNSDNAAAVSSETPTRKADAPVQKGSGRKALPTSTNQSSAARKSLPSVSKSPLPSVEDSGRKRVLIPARRAIEDLGHTAKTKTASERSASQKAPTPSEESSAPGTKTPTIRALSAVPDGSREPETKKKTSAEEESGNVTGKYKQVIETAGSKEPENVTRVATKIPMAPEAAMNVSPQPPAVESEPTKSTEPTKNIEPVKDVESTKSSKPKNVEPEVVELENAAPKTAEPNDKPNNVEHKSTSPKTTKTKAKAKKTPVKDHPRSQPSANVQIIGHRKMAKGDFDFELHLKSGDTTWWDEEVDLFSESPEIVSDYWSSVRGGRERACDGMWKVWKIFGERRVGHRKESLVGWLGTMDRTWEPKAYVRANALDVLKEWEQERAQEEEEEAKNMDWDVPDDDEEEGGDGALKSTTRKRATPTRHRKGQAYKVKKPRLAQ